jgi:hypothetical protein
MRVVRVDSEGEDKRATLVHAYNETLNPRSHKRP